MSIITGLGQGTGQNTGLFEALKVVFDEPLNQNLLDDSDLYDIFQQDMDIPVKDTPGGRYIEMAHYAADGGGFGARREGGALPQSTPPTVFNGLIYLRKNHMNVEMSGETMRRVKQGESAWLTWASQTLPNAVRRLSHHLDRQAVGFGSGVGCRVAAGYTTGTTIPVDRAFGLTGFLKAVFQFQRNDFIRAAADIDGVTLRANPMRILNVDLAANTITVNAASTGLAAGDFLAIGDAAGNNFRGAPGNQPVEMMGLLGIVDNGNVLTTFQNVVRATTPEYRAQRINAATWTATTALQSRLTEDLLIFADDTAYELGEGRPDCIITSRAAERQYAASLKGSAAATLRLLDPRNFTNDGGKNRGFEINLNGRRVMSKVARKVPDNITFMLEKSTLKKWQNGGGFSWDDTTGSMFERVVDSNGRYDAFYATGVLEAELGCVNPRRNVIIDNINPALN